MALEGGAGIGNGIIKRPPQQCSVAVETAAHHADGETEEEDEGKPWIARKWISSLAVCLVALPFLAIMVSRRDRPLPLASGWTSAATARTTYDRRESNQDGLLGGLLVPGFDEQSCISRYQSTSHLKKLARSPSTHLVKRLREQEALQRRCGPGTETYRRAAERLGPREDGTSTTTDDDACKYLVLVPYRGLGNRILAMASAFLYAMLTDRVLLVHRGTSLPDLLCEPFQETSWLLPPDFPLRDLENLTGEVPESYRNLVREYGRAASVSDLPYVFVDLDHACTYHDKLFYCDDHREFLHRAPWLVMRTDGYFVPALFLNPAYQEELDKLFPRKDSVFYLLARYLFHPTNKVWGLITRFYDSYLKNSDERLGIQVRVFDGDTPFKHVLDQILACTSQEHLLPEVVAQDPGPPASTAGARGWSTFGYVGHGLGGLTPWIMFKPENLTTPDPPCRRAASMEPCLHGPPFYDCRARRGADTGKLVPHVRHCEDMSWGLKLVHPE
ncbi:galactoside 2-alpha-L-fucosyltransferase-like [Triticum dicoccoides]|uniref:galactoside 2-alpha-L-fucosyltransferase-like n=1 Tax=Triticum dicoccoides TaxID=85692 RepID=UPI00189138EC|nr:galactoside 2-alpha-L-fucosyltransferase-like [Triticum dicoccoides]